MPASPLLPSASSLCAGLFNMVLGTKRDLSFLRVRLGAGAGAVAVPVSDLLPPSAGDSALLLLAIPGYTAQHLPDSSLPISAVLHEGEACAQLATQVCLKCLPHACWGSPQDQCWLISNMEPGLAGCLCCCRSCILSQAPCSFCLTPQWSAAHPTSAVRSRSSGA